MTPAQHIICMMCVHWLVLAVLPGGAYCIARSASVKIKHVIGTTTSSVQTASVSVVLMP